MIRRLTFFVLATALIVSACGRQVTPNPGGTDGTGLASGFMKIKFRVSQAFSFGSVRYWVVFNTRGNGSTPYANGYLNNYQNYSFAFVVGGNGTTVPSPLLYEYVAQANGAPAVVVQLFYTPQQVIFTPNSNGQSTEFTIQFDRTLFAGITSPSPSPSPSASPGFSNMWYYNYFTTDSSNNPLDALGIGGAQDTSYQGGPLDISTVFDTSFNVPAGAALASQPSAQITGGEILNNP